MIVSVEDNHFLVYISQKLIVVQKICFILLPYDITFDKPPFTQRNFVEYILPFCFTGNVSAWKLVAMVQW